MESFKIEHYLKLKMFVWKYAPIFLRMLFSWKASIDIKIYFEKHWVNRF